MSASSGQAGSGADGKAGSGGSGSTAPRAIAILSPLPQTGSSSGTASAGAGGSRAGAGGSRAGAGGSRAGAGGSRATQGGSGGAGKAGAGGTGTGAGLEASGTGGGGVTAGSGSTTTTTTAGSGAGGAAASASGDGIHGMAVFTQMATGIALVINVTGCSDGKSYPVHIHEGTSCDTTETQGGHWGANDAMYGTTAAGAGGSSAAAGSGAASASTGGTGGTSSVGGAGGAWGMPLVLRGEDIPDIKCTGGTGMTSTSRSTPDPRLAWTIGISPRTDVVGHVIVVHDGAARIACGKIEKK
jgi:hypothetical protein